MFVVYKAVDLEVGRQYWFRSLPHIVELDIAYCPLPKLYMVKQQPCKPGDVFIWNGITRLYLHSDRDEFTGNMLAIGPVATMNDDIFNEYIKRDTQNGPNHD